MLFKAAAGRSTCLSFLTLSVEKDNVLGLVLVCIPKGLKKALLSTWLPIPKQADHCWSMVLQAHPIRECRGYSIVAVPGLANSWWRLSGNVSLRSNRAGVLKATAASTQRTSISGGPERPTYPWRQSVRPWHHNGEPGVGGKPAAFLHSGLTE